MLTKEKTKAIIHEKISKMYQTIASLENLYPGYMNYMATLHTKEIAKSIRHENLIPGDILDAAEEFEDKESAKVIWYPMFLKSIDVYLAQK